MQNIKNKHADQPAKKRADKKCADHPQHSGVFSVEPQLLETTRFQNVFISKMFCVMLQMKGKVTPLQAYTGPQGSTR
jgi:hypothetical protein